MAVGVVDRIGNVSTKLADEFYGWVFAVLPVHEEFSTTRVAAEHITELALTLLVPRQLLVVIIVIIVDLTEEYFVVVEVTVGVLAFHALLELVTLAFNLAIFNLFHICFDFSMIIDAKITWFRRSLLLFISAQNINFVYTLELSSSCNNNLKQLTLPHRWKLNNET